MSKQKVDVTAIHFQTPEIALLADRFQISKMTAKEDLKILKRKLLKIENDDDETPRQRYYAARIRYKITGEAPDFVYLEELYPVAPWRKRESVPSSEKRSDKAAKAGKHAESSTKKTKHAKKSVKTGKHAKSSSEKRSDKAVKTGNGKHAKSSTEKTKHAKKSVKTGKHAKKSRTRKSDK